MADSSSTPRYSEQQMALILKRAAELQEGADGRGSELSLSEIQEVAAEAGISPSYVAEAAAELLRPGPRVGWLGAPTRFHEERIIAAVLSPTGTGELVAYARRELGLHGQVTQVLDTVEWSAQSPFGWTFITLAPRGGGTRIAVTAARGDQALLVGLAGLGIGVLTALGGAVVALSVADSPLVASLIIAGAGVAGAVASTRLLWRSTAARWARRTRDIVDALADRATQVLK
jgi:hypothetical protein